MVERWAVAVGRPASIARPASPQERISGLLLGGIAKLRPVASGGQISRPPPLDASTPRLLIQTEFGARGISKNGKRTGARRDVRSWRQHAAARGRDFLERV